MYRRDTCHLPVSAAFGSLIGRQVISRRRAIVIDYNSKYHQERFLFAANTRLFVGLALYLC
jgi:hypothetical protein